MEVMEVSTTEDGALKVDPRPESESEKKAVDTRLWPERHLVADRSHCSCLAPLIQEDSERFNRCLKFLFVVALSLGMINLVVLEWVTIRIPSLRYLPFWGDMTDLIDLMMRLLGLAVFAACLAVCTVMKKLVRNGRSAAVKEEKTISGLIQQV